MTEKIEKQYGFIVKLSVLGGIMLQYSTSIATPALGAISAAMPDVSPELIKQISTLPNLCMIIFAFLCGQLTKKFTTKKVLYIAIVFLFIGGILPAFFGDIMFILACRLIFGVGYGLVMPLASAFIIELFVGNERDAMMGFKGATGAAAGIIYQTLSGYLAAIHWRYAFLCYFLIIPIAILMILKLPETPVKKAPETATQQGVQAKPKLQPWTWLIISLNIFLQIAAFSFMTNMAIVIQKTSVGTPAHAGLVMSTFTGITFLSGLCYFVIVKILKRLTLPISVGLWGLAFVILLNASSLPMFFVAAVVFGVGWGLFNPDMNLKVADSVDKMSGNLAIAWYYSFAGIGQFLSPIALAWVTTILGITGPKAQWTIAAPFLLISFIIMIIFVIFYKPKKSQLNTTTLNS